LRSNKEGVVHRKARNPFPGEMKHDLLGHLGIMVHEMIAISSHEILSYRRMLFFDTQYQWVEFLIGKSDRRVKSDRPESSRISRKFE